MLATKLKGHITRDRRLVVQIPRELEAGTVEVILLQTSSQAPKRRTRRGTRHPAFGIWAQRSDFHDPAAFAAQLRERIENRADGNGRG